MVRYWPPTEAAFKTCCVFLGVFRQLNSICGKSQPRLFIEGLMAFSASSRHSCACWRIVLLRPLTWRRDTAGKKKFLTACSRSAKSGGRPLVRSARRPLSPFFLIDEELDRRQNYRMGQAAPTAGRIWFWRYLPTARDSASPSALIAMAPIP